MSESPGSSSRRQRLHQEFEEGGVSAEDLLPPGVAKAPSIVVCAVGTWGDFLPAREVAERLARSGYSVLMIAREIHRADVESRGMRFADYPSAILSIQAPAPKGMSWLGLTSVGQNLLYYYRARATAYTQTRYVFRLLSALREAGWEYVLGSDWQPGFREFAEVHPNTAISYLVVPAAIHSEHAGSGIPEPPIGGYARRLYRRLYWYASDLLYYLSRGAARNRFRKEIGLARRFRFRNAFDEVYGPTLGLFSEWFAPPQQDWPATECVGFVDAGESAMAEVPSDLEAFLRQAPTVLFTCGSQCMRIPDFLPLAVEWSRTTGRQAILLGASKDGLSLMSHPLVRWVPFVPIESVLPHCEAIVHHGGIGTTIQAVRHRKPQVIFPIFLDQWSQAKRVEELGLGVYLRPSERRLAHLSTALDRVSSERGFRESVARYADDESAKDPLTGAVQFVAQSIESLRAKSGATRRSIDVPVLAEEEK